MGIIKVEQNTEEWLELRKGKIGGSNVGDIITLKGNKVKVGFYQLLADKLGIEEDASEDKLQRGHDLESGSIAEFTKETGLKVETGIYVINKKYPNFGLSPDGLIKKGKKYSAGVESKSLKASLHLKAWFEKTIPDEYDEQSIWYFVMDEELDTLYFLFYNPDVTMKPFFYITINRKDVVDKIELYKQFALEKSEYLEACIESLI